MNNMEYLSFGGCQLPAVWAAQGSVPINSAYHGWLELVVTGPSWFTDVAPKKRRSIMRMLAVRHYLPVLV